MELDVSCDLPCELSQVSRAVKIKGLLILYRGIHYEILVC